MAPPPDWKRLREEGEKKIRSLIVPWLEARKAILVPCRACRGGRAPDPARPGRERPCDDCLGSRFVLGPDFDPGKVDAPLLGRPDKTGYWESIRKCPGKASGIAIGAFEVREIRVVGYFAYAMVEIRRVAPAGTSPEEMTALPEVTTWYRINRDWKVLDPDRPPPIIDFGGMIVPPRFLPKPKHEPAAAALLARAAEKMPAPREEDLDRVSFRVAARGTGARHGLVFTASRVGGRYAVERKAGVFRSDEGRAAKHAGQAVKAVLDALLSPEEGLLPDPADYHLETQAGAVVCRGFAPGLFMQKVTLELDALGLPRRIVRERPGGPTLEISPRFEEGKGVVLRTAARHRQGKWWLSYRARWAKDRGAWLPRKVEVETPRGAWSLTLTPSWEKRRSGL